MIFATFWQIFNLILSGLIITFGVYFLWLIIRALKKYLGEGRKAATQEAASLRISLSERLKALRTSHGFTQELVAESLGVSRQAVSKWENGTSEPSTSNLFALAKLYGIPVTELLKDIDV